VVDLDCLAALDCLQWLRTGARAAEILECSQPNISRSARKCEKIFGISLKKKLTEWQIIGDDSLIQAERQVHQLHRWNNGSPLRLDTQHWLRDTYSPLALQGWIKGNMNYLDYHQPLNLIKSRIIDAWLCSAPDIPRSDELTAIQLCSMPSLLVVVRDHPLTEHLEAMTLEDMRPYPLLPLPRGSFPVYESVLESMGLQHHDPAVLSHSSLPAEDLFVGIASPLTMGLYGPRYVALPIQLPIKVGDVLMVRTEFVNHPRTQALVDDLLQHLQQITQDLPSVELLGRPVVQAPK
jgi:DNA-binding transcriptional LysR family regulator